MTTQPITIHAPAARDISIEDHSLDTINRRPSGGPHEYTIRFLAYPDKDGNNLYDYRENAATPPAYISTVGDLTLGDIDRTSISIEWKGDTITGVIRDIRTDTDTLLNGLMVSGRMYRRGDRRTRVRIRFTNFVVSDLPLDHPCEVTA